MADEKANLGDKVMCLNQFFKPETAHKVKRKGCGYCQTCTFDSNNQYCKRNTPIKVRTFYANPKEYPTWFLPIRKTKEFFREVWGYISKSS